MFTKYGKPILFLVLISLLFFYKTILFGKVPFPGDLLLSQYAPWRHVSYEGYVAGSVPSKDQYFDVIRELYPWKTQVLRSPLWNPHNGSGAPLLANYQSQVFYPLSLLYFIFPQITAWTIMIIIQPILGSIFLYLFASEIGLTSAAAVFTALLFNFSAFANVWMEFTTIWHTILWLPLLLYLVERNVKQKNLFLWQQFLFVVALFSAITGGHPQDFLTLFLFLMVYIIARRSFFLLTLLPLPFFLAAVQLFPTIELFRNSARVTHEYQTVIEKMLVQWWQLPIIAVQDFFGNPATKTSITGDYVGKTLSIGIVGFFFAIAGLWRNKFFSWTAIAILLLSVRSPLTELFYRFPLPILSTGTPTRILFLFALSLSLLAGFGFDALRNNPKKITVVLLTWGIFLPLWLVAPLKRPMILATILLAATTAVVFLARYKRILLLAVIPVAIAELLYGFLKFNPFVPKSFVFPENPLIVFLQKNTGIDRVWGYGTAGIEANFATQENMYSPDVTDPLNLKWYNRLIQASFDGNLAQTFTRTTRSDAYLAPGYGENDLPDNPYRLRLMDVLGVKYVIDRSENPKNDKTFPKNRFKEIWHKEDWTVYENLKAAPKFFLTDDVYPYQDEKDFEKQFFSDDFVPGKTVLLTQTDWDSLPRFIDNPRDNAIDVISYNPTRIEVMTKTGNPQLLFINDTFDNGWKAQVNGKPARVYKATFAFRALPVPKGQSTIILTYRPRSFETGLVISAITGIATICYFWMTNVFGKKRAPQKI